MRREHEPLEIPTDVDRRFGRRLAAARERAGLTHAGLAAAMIELDTHEAEIEAWEQGLMVIYIDELIAVCRALDTTPNHLCGLDEQ